MKATGIVRKIDELGRIVVPKEIRRTLKIRVGDPMEIFTDHEGEIILRKYSPIHELSEFAQEYANSIAKTTGNMVVISDMDRFIAATGLAETAVLGNRISEALELTISKKESVVATKEEKGYVNIIDGKTFEYNNQVIAPIISDGDTIGSVIILSTEVKLGETERLLALTAAAFLGSQME